MNDIWLIWSNYHLAWWRSERSGYTMDIAHAGRYTLLEAEQCCATRSNMRTPGGEQYPAELIVPAPEYVVELLRRKESAHP